MRDKNKKIILICSVTGALLATAFLILFLVILPSLKDRSNGGSDFTVNNVQIQLENTAVGDSVDKEFTEDDFKFSVLINDGDTGSQDSPDVSWKISGDTDLNCTIDNGGKFSIGDTLGSLTVEVCVTGKNSLSASTIVNILAPHNQTLFKVEAEVIDSALGFIEGQKFAPNGIAVSAVFINNQNDTCRAFIHDFTYDGETALAPGISDVPISYTFKNVTRHSLVPIVIYPKTLQSIEVSTPPKNILYTEGQSLSTDGMKIVANYEFIRQEVKDYIVSTEASILDPSVQYIEIAYTENDITKSVRQAITVTPRTLRNIIVEHDPNQLEYIQGQFFNKDGLRVIAIYEHMELDVTDFLEFDLTGRLYSANTEIQFTYTEGTKQFGGKFNLNVNMPYTDVRTIKFSNPYDATLSWLYEYMSDEGVVSVDDTDFVNYDILQFDPTQGIYTVPVGATVTLFKISPAIKGFDINGESLPIEYPSNSCEFVVGFGVSDIEIDFVKVIGSRTTVRFSSEGLGQNFAYVYSGTYDGALSATDLSRLSQIYEDTATQYYTYANGQNLYTFEELANFTFNADTLFIVSKNERISANAVTINVIYDKATIKSVIDKTSTSLNVLPKIDRVGYSLSFSTIIGGPLLNDVTFVEWLAAAKNDAALYASYVLKPYEVIGSIVGVYTYEDAVEQVELTIAFKADGTYSYLLRKSGAENCSFVGVYKDNLDESYTILSVETDNGYSLIAPDDFIVEILPEKTLSSISFILNTAELSVVKSTVVLTKQETARR